MRAVAALTGLAAVAALAMALAGANPLLGFAALFRGALGGPHQLAETLVQTTALLFPALAVALAFRAGLFNIGADGQLIVGGLAAGIAGTAPLFAGPAALPLLLVAGALAGAAWGSIAGILRARFGANEVIATLMLNVFAGLLANYLVVGPLHAAGAAGPETAELPPNAWLATIVPATRLTLALPIALGLAVVLRVVLNRTLFGYELRATGEAPEAAARAGISLARISVERARVLGRDRRLGRRDDRRRHPAPLQRRAFAGLRFHRDRRRPRRRPRSATHRRRRVRLWHLAERRL